MASRPFREVDGDPALAYELKHTLGTGAFGVVRLALCRQDGSQWAIKCIDQRGMAPADLASLKEEIATRVDFRAAKSRRRESPPTSVAASSKSAA